jgi:hypothetical protein
MKKTILLLSIASFVFYGCKKEETATSSTPSLKKFYFKLDGADKNVSSSIAQHTNGWILISGSTIPNESISLRIEDSVQTGLNYNFSSNGPFRLFYTPDNYINSYTSVSGIANVVSYDTIAKKISGTYNCLLVGNQSTPDTIVVTNGEFNITYP